MNQKRTKQAQKTRRQIARTFIAMESHMISVSDVLGITQEMPDCVRRMRVYDVVRRFPHMGGDGASNVLRKAKVWPLTRMGRLTDGERSAILQHLPPRTKSIA